jgi:hypothetical protein
MLRDWTGSDKISGLSVHAERFFVRLIMKVDDFGCFYADTRLLKANLFPLLLDSIREADLLRWMAECQKAGLIVLYVSDSKKYLQIKDFRQRLDKAKSKYPQPVNGFPEVVNEFPAEVEVEVEPEVERKRVGFAPPDYEDVLVVMQEKLDDFTAMGEAKKFVDYYGSIGWKVGKNKMTDWRKAVGGWISRMKNFNPKSELVKNPAQKTAQELKHERLQNEIYGR